jgi:uncharacterized protein HemY
MSLALQRFIRDWTTLQKAEAAYKQALDLHKQAKDDLGMGNALSHLGDLYRKQNKLSEAESHYKKALQSHKKASDKLGQANDLKGLGGIYHRQEMPRVPLRNIMLL